MLSRARGHVPPELYAAPRGQLSRLDTGKQALPYQVLSQVHYDKTACG